MDTQNLDVDLAVLFLRSLYRYCEGGFINFRFLPPAKNIYIPVCRIEAVPSILKSNEDQNAYFGVATRTEGDGTKQGIIEIPALWVDLDFKGVDEKAKDKVRQSYKDFPLKPTYGISTGGGYHFYWRLKEPAEKGDIPQVEDLLRRLAAYFSGDTASTDASRILRVPGTFNFKYQPPREVVLKVFNPQNEFNLGDFDFLPQIATTGDKARRNPGWEKELLKGVPEGNRNAAITRLAGRYLRKGLLIDEFLPILLDVNSRFKPPLDTEEVIMAAESISKTHRRNQQNGSEVGKK